MTEKNTKEAKEEKETGFKGKYIYAVGRRKTSVAQIRIYKKGDGSVLINGKDFKKYFTEDESEVARQPLKLAGKNKDLNVSVLVRGGGKKSQTEAIRHGIARALVEMDEEYKLPIKAKGWLTRDARKKERKKPGLKKARRAPQWSKR